MIAYAFIGRVIIHTGRYLEAWIETRKATTTPQPVPSFFSTTPRPWITSRMSRKRMKFYTDIVASTGRRIKSLPPPWRDDCINIAIRVAPRVRNVWPRTRRGIDESKRWMKFPSFHRLRKDTDREARGKPRWMPPLDAFSSASRKRHPNHPRSLIILCPVISTKIIFLFSFPFSPPFFLSFLSSFHHSSPPFSF